MSTPKNLPARKPSAGTTKTITKPLAVGTAALLAVGLSITGALPASASPAPSPTTEACAVTTQGPIATNQISQGWTFADTRATGHNEFTAAGLRVWTQGATSTDKAAAYKSVDIALKDVGVPQLHFGATTGTLPSLQLVTDFDNNGTADGILVGEPAAYPGGGYWVPNSAAAFVKDAAPSHAGGHGSANHGTLDDWLVSFPDARVLQIGYSLGSGVHADAIIESVEVGCVNYAFSSNDVYTATNTVTVDDSQIAPFEDGNPASATYNYETWHEGYANATRAYSTEADGLHFGDSAPSQIMLGTPTAVSSAELEALLTSASVAVIDGAVTLQIPVTYGANNTFTTLRSGFLTVGTENHFSVSDTWKSSKALKNNDTTTHTPANATSLADLVAFMGKQGNIKLLGFGVQASHAATVQDLTFNGTKYSFVPSTLEATTNHVIVPDSAIDLLEVSDPAAAGYNYTKWHEGYNNAIKSFSVVGAALKLGDPAHSQVLKGLDAVLAGSELYTQLTSHAAVTVDSGTVTYQVAFRHAGNIGWGTLRSASLSAGTHTFTLSDPWMSSKAIGTSINANTAYPLGDILDALNAQGNATGEAFGVQADAAAQVSSIVWGNTEYTFGPKLDAAVPTTTGTAKVGQTLTAQQHASSWTPSTGVAHAYQWKADGVAIAGATSATYKLTASQVGKKITVTVTGSLAGYAGAAATSAETAKVINSQIVVSRLAGNNRYETAAKIAQEWHTASIVYIATGRGFADALSAGPAATFNDAPLLLTEPSSLTSATKAELLRLKPSQIVIVGGPGAVSEGVKAAIQALSFHPTVKRIGGIDRYETSRMLAAATFPAGTVTSAYLADGRNFPDALTASPAAAGFSGPVVLIRGNANTADAATLALLNTLGVNSVKVAGGSGVVSNGIVAHLNTKFTTVKRNSGLNRYTTAVAINADAFSSATTVYVATGADFADALAGAVLAGAKDAPLFISTTSCIPKVVMTAITNLGNPKVVLLGGTGVLTSGVASLNTCS
ncbi:cell wall-binding repeat-containing protein [Salinibacterium sp. M195]|uniref:cell wall-binding repeat-containing protein n=1 Tax=Salinibacterium sp. M195 TaxID=2583374 RepID=UPI001C638F51|nr:cell wall-binding repeat-containing protein [Salinibacterium sp. M195]QYH34758.1 hypothetical protein FFT87_01680 [Salinibacterium sp. M195]